MKAQRGRRVFLYTFLYNSALNGGAWSALLTGSFIPGKETWYPFYKRLDGPRAGLVGCKKSRPDCPARSEPLYRQRYRGPV